MRATPSPDLLADILEGLQAEDLDYYDRVLLPQGESSGAAMNEAIEHIKYDIPLPVDLMARLETHGIIIDEFETWVRKRLDVCSDTIH